MEIYTVLRVVKHTVTDIYFSSLLGISNLLVLSVDYIITYLGIDSSAIIRRCDVNSSC
jgi:hypothetical protein